MTSWPSSSPSLFPLVTQLICYFSVGTYEPARVTADAALNISWTALEQQLGGSSVPGPLYLSYMSPPFSEERWLAIDRADTRSALVNQVRQYLGMP